MLDLEELKKLSLKVDGILTPEDRKAMGFDPRNDPAKLESRVRGLVEGNLGQSVTLEPLVRMVDKRTLYPWQGKESDSEIAFNFESIMDAQQLYDFVVNLGLLEPGEIKIKMIENQASVHFASHVLVMKPEVLQAAMLAYYDSVEESSKEAFHALAENIADVIVNMSGVPKVKVKSEDTVVRFYSTKKPGARSTRHNGKGIRCWEGKKEIGLKLANVMSRRINNERITDDELNAMLEAVKHINEMAKIVEDEFGEACKTPGKKKKSKGKGKGFARGDGKGPMGDPKDDENMTEAKVDISPYVNNHGAKPRGGGSAMWMFGFDEKYPTNDEIFKFNGSLKDAKKAALKAGKKAGAGVVYLLP